MRHSRIGVCALSVLVAIGCNATPSPETAPNPKTESNYAIHIYVQDNGEEARVDLGPASEISGVLTSPLTTRSLHTQDVHPTDFDGGGPPLAQESTVDDPNGKPWQTAWALVAGAAVECGVAPYLVHLPAWDSSPDSHPWFVFDRPPESCASVLQREEQLLCVGDKLAEIADAVGDVKWEHAAASGTPPADYDAHDPSGLSSKLATPWRIPPQADKDRFIARDLSIHVLAHIPMLDALHWYYGFGPTDPYGGDNPVLTCQEMFTKVAQNGALSVGAAFPEPAYNIAETHVVVAFGGWYGKLTHPNGLDDVFEPAFPIYPPSAVPIAELTTSYFAWTDPSGGIHRQPHAAARVDHTREIARTALQVEGQILRASGKLLYDVIRRSVYSDMAGAEQRAAAAMDPVRAPRISWGDEGPYNSLAHAVRVLTGRWEMGPFKGDPACGGVTALDLLTKAYGGDRSARSGDTPIQTSGQAGASQLVEDAGIVIPSCALASPSLTEDALKSAIAAQLRYQAAAANRTVAGVDSAFGQAVSRMVNELKLEDLRFALERSYRTYRLLTNTDDVQAPCRSVNPESAGLHAVGATSAAPELTAISGVALAGGISRARLPKDVMAHAAGMVEASQCNEVDGVWDAFGVSQHPHALQGQIQDTPDSIPRAVFQDSFHIGQALARRLTVLRELTSPLDRSMDGDPNSIARTGLAEIQSWAGSQRAVATATGKLSIVLTGFDYTDFGTTATSDPAVRETAIKDSLAFVFGPPWVAECAARLRKDCPDNFEAQYVVNSKAISVTQHAAGSGPSGAVQAAGVFGPEFVIDIDVDTTSNGTPSFTVGLRGKEVSNDHMYVVRRRDLNDPAGRGAVLGALTLRTPSGTDAISTSFAISPMQRELLQNALGLGKWVGLRPPRVGEVSIAQSAGYCVDGVARDLFVPMENELTSDSDGFENSWRHYLSLAKGAAERADRLGEALLLLDEKQEERREAAGEALGAICGDLSAIARVGIDDRGRVVPSPEDETLKVCLGDEKKDVVFLASLPPNLAKLANGTSDTPAAASAATSWIKEHVLRCGGAGRSNELCKKEVISFATLNLVRQTPSPPPDTEVCPEIAAAARSLRTRFDGGAFNRSLQQSYAGDDQLKFAASGLAIHVDLGGDWTVTSNGVSIMGTLAPNLWPGCLRAGGACSRAAKTMNTLYRTCGPDVVLGDCEKANDVRDAAAELNTLRWRVEGSLWFLGALTGGVHSGMFQTPIPVFLDSVVPLLPNGTGIPVAAFYRGKETPVASSWPGLQAYGLDSNPADYTGPGESVPTPPSLNALGTFYSVPDRFEHYGSRALASEIPSWFYGQTYSQATAYRGLLRHVLAGNAPTYADFRYRFPYPKPGGELVTNPSGYPIRAFYSFVTPMDGMSCANSVGARASGGAVVDRAGVPLEGLVSKIKEFGNPYAAGADAIAQDDGRALRGRTLTSDRATQPPWQAWGLVFEHFNQEHSLYTDFGPIGYVEKDNISSYVMTEFAPSTRVAAFVNPGAVNGDCAAAATLTQAIGISCVARETPLDANFDSPLSITDVSQLPLLLAWIDRVGELASAELSGMYIENVPLRVIEDLRDKRVGTGSKKGASGAEFLHMEDALTILPDQWAKIPTNLSLARQAIADAQIAIAAAANSQNAALSSIALQQVQLESRETQSVLGFLQNMGSSLSSMASSGGANGGAAFVSLGAGFMSVTEGFDTDAKTLHELYKQRDFAHVQEELAIAAELSKLNETNTVQFANIRGALGDVRSTVSKVLEAGSKLATLEDQAQYEAAKGTGQDYGVTAAGQTIPIPVNTVLRRQTNATEIRYRRALTDAKGLAYMARRAIEQRIGIPLSAISTRVGPLDPPASWADDVCRLTGMNYARLRTAAGPDASADTRHALDAQVTSEFADAFVGDYVAKLESFVEYYNAEFPSHEGDDTAALSLRDDLLGPNSTCAATAPNLLYYSGQLEGTGSPVSGAGDSQGWRTHPCASGAGKCLVVMSGSGLASPKAGPHGAPVATAGDPLGSLATESHGVTWLFDQAATPSSSPVTTDVGPPSGWPSGLVSQAVQLEPGSYVLSWWDQARDANGKLVTSESQAVPYRAEVYDDEWRVLEEFRGAPFVATTGAPASNWSPRHSLSVVVAKTGRYYIAFGATAPSEPRLGSVAIAQVQLETTPPGGPAVPYVETNGDRTTLKTDCPRSSSELRSLFKRTCDNPQTCYYELSVPLTILTQDLQDGISRLSGKLARGNYNFRHITAALNVVGTGVHDCSSAQSVNCYGIGYVEYSMQHDAENAVIVDWNGDNRVFNFGVASIERGKALAAERYITMPVSSADSVLMGQPGIEKQELRGRPLDGTYKLRIWDSPDLKWSRVEDIQVIFKYRYWSRILKN
jgi:hypothetical protein